MFVMQYTYCMMQKSLPIKILNKCFCSCIKITKATLAKLMGLLSKIVNYLH